MIENNNNKGVSKQLAFAISGVALLIIAVAGSAYAYFTASATSDGGISGTTLNVKLDKPIVTLLSTKATGGLIPIYDGTVNGHTSQLSAAATATNQCVDKNGYTVCKVYKISVKNSGSTATTVNTTLNLNNGGATNLKWARMTSATVVDTTLPTNSTVSTGKELGAGATLEQYIMVYLKNTGADQTSTDAGKTISGTVTVTASTGANVQAEF
jgi:hypothetical protein